MAIDIHVRKPSVTAIATEIAPAPLTVRLSLSLRRRRMRRVQQALEYTAWIGGASLLIFFIAMGVLSLH